MANVFIDPYLFACPQPAEGIQEFKNYINALMGWSYLNSLCGADLYISSWTFEILDKTNSFPPHDAIKAAITTFDLPEIQPYDVTTLIYGLLTKLPSFEDVFSYSDVLTDKYFCNPSYHLENRSKIFAEQYERITTLISLIIQENGLASDDTALITKELDEDKCETEISAEIIYCDCARCSALVFPFDITEEFILCNSPHGLYMFFDPIEVWKLAKSQDEYYEAIKIYIYQNYYEENILEILNNLSWSFHVDFLDSADDHGFLHETNKIKNILRACSETILKTNLADTHALRKGKGANDSQVTRGDYGAWRRDIDYEYHLHYWQSSENLELACIVVHNYMKIPT